MDIKQIGQDLSGIVNVDSMVCMSRLGVPIVYISIVEDMCATIATVMTGAQLLTFVLARGQRIGSVPTDIFNISQAYYAGEVSLGTLFLSGCQPKDNRCLIPYEQRMPLALRLASNPLQLYRTQWLQIAWSKERIYFPISTGKGPDFSRPYVCIPIDDTTHTGSQQNPVELRNAILELGILLLEIWHEKAFANQYNLARTCGMHEPRRALAFDWMANTSNPPPLLYNDAISYCITGINHGEAKYWNWEDTRLWRALCQNVIEPLSKNCQLWSGHSTTC